MEANCKPKKEPVGKVWVYGSTVGGSLKVKEPVKGHALKRRFFPGYFMKYVGSLKISQILKSGGY